MKDPNKPDVAVELCAACTRRHWELLERQRAPAFFRPPDFPCDGCMRRIREATEAAGVGPFNLVLLPQSN